MRPFVTFLLPVLLFLTLPHTATVLRAQHDEYDPCGFGLRKPDEQLVWAYGRDELMVDLQRWALHPMSTIDVIGQTVLHRPIYHMVLTNPDSRVPKKRIWIHARTHPIESESSHVAREIVDELLGGSELGRLLLDHAYVHVLPMLNLDGVELHRARENANGVDLESNWAAAVPEPEVVALRRHLALLMQSSVPIQVALNLHSAYNCKRYFVYHAEAGTSALFAQRQRYFIDLARARFPGGIEPYDYFVSWTTETPDRYPESWFWLNFREDVMALTYEDMNCATAGSYDRTARALLGAAADYLGLTGIVDVDDEPAGVRSGRFADVFPNPASRDGVVTVRLAPASGWGASRDASTSPGGVLRVTLVDLLGREIATLYEGEDTPTARTLLLPTNGIVPGTYVLRAAGTDRVETRPLLILR
ncbi:MAG: M14 family zinc carboxypeptidase [Bacteroidota bacterium]|jgi:hypothetical protein|nr:M14 family zinc carboxypeptidase [Bacteroidota bacterium]